MADGDNEAFVSTLTSSEFEGPTQGLFTMGYYRRRDLPFYYALADAFTICDNYHCSVLGPTHPNRLMSISGTIDPSGHAGGPVVITNEDSDAIYSVSWDTMPEVLEDAGDQLEGLHAERGHLHAGVQRAAWPGGERRHPPVLPPVLEPEFQPLPEGVPAALPGGLRDRHRSGSAPAVSWIIPPVGYDEHPSAPPALGEWLTSQVLAALTSNPTVWSKTVLFHMYDENDGLFDHVPPPTPPRGTPGEFLTKKPLPSDADGIRGPVGMGFRVPMLVLSPFSRGGHVASEVFDHTSQLRFLEERFGVRAPNISRWRRHVAGDLTSTLHMHRPDVSVPALPSTAHDQKADVDGARVHPGRHRREPTRTCPPIRCRSTRQCRVRSLRSRAPGPRAGYFQPCMTCSTHHCGAAPIRSPRSQ